MWLLNTATLRIEHFDNKIPKYAILSHRWEANEELAFGDVKEAHQSSHPGGYRKVKAFCDKARDRHFTYVWVDTCCVDKKSSAELSEAINSMYVYYKRAAICYAYLNDVNEPSHLGQSLWFLRGWTLQELLAPSKLHFFNAQWHPIGSRSKLAAEIEKITGIPRKALHDFCPEDYCIAERFSWANSRKTTREEDVAYCMLGIFGINMPLLYGEGPKAFQRLQEEIMKTSIDMSIFLWCGSACETFGMLASSPTCFTRLGRALKKSLTRTPTLFQLSDGWDTDNAGIIIEASIQPHYLTAELKGVFTLSLHEPNTNALSADVTIYIQQEDTRHGRPVFRRISINGGSCGFHLALRSGVYLPFERETIRLRLARRSLGTIHLLHKETRGMSLELMTDSLVECQMYMRSASDPDASLQEWQPISHPNFGTLACRFDIDPRNATGIHSYLTLALPDDVQILICLGLNNRFQPMCLILPMSLTTMARGLHISKMLKQFDWRLPGRQQYDAELDLLCLLGADRHLGFDTDLGIDIEIQESCHGVGDFSIEITFNAIEYLRHYLPDEVLASDCLLDLARSVYRSVYRKMSELEREVLQSRRSRFLVA